MRSNMHIKNIKIMMEGWAAATNRRSCRGMFGRLALIQSGAKVADKTAIGLKYALRWSIQMETKSNHHSF
jgi:hypothetical protein